MKDLTKICTLLSLSLFFGACQQEMLQENYPDGSITILARTDDGMQTRTCVDGSASGGTVGILWTPDDCIGVYGSEGTVNAKFASSSTGVVPEAEFSGTLPSGEEPAYAYYPYSADNDGSDASAVSGTLNLEQTFDFTEGKLESDYKVGTPTFFSIDGSRYEFTFTHLFSLLKFDIDATGSALEGDRLESITLSLPSGRRLGGDFTFDVTSGDVTWAGTRESANEMVMNWSDTPALEDGASYTGYMTCAPDIHAGDEIRVTILTSQFKAEFVRKALVDFQANTCYTFPLTLEHFRDMEVTARPVITSFSFTAEANEGKILSTRLVADSEGNTKPVSSTEAEEVLAIGTDEISGCIPYLFDFKLKPTFTVPEGMTVTVDGQTQTSGESEQDFSFPVTYTVSNGVESRSYTVSVTNTGLPVAVLEHDGGTVKWAEAGIMIRGKEEDWGESHFTLYNADGTVDVERALCGSRLRGNSTQNFPKKPFALKFDEKVGIQGLPTDKRWELLANWMDRTMLRNTVAFEVANKTAGALADGLGWNPRGVNVELVINERHVGNYFLCEKVKIDGDRIDIKDCYEDVVDGGNANPTVADCGYLLEFDDAMDEVNTFRTGRGLPVMFKDEVPENGTLFNDVKTKVEKIEDYLERGNYSSAYALLDINSVIDWFLVQELVMNDEYKHPKSAYMYIDGDGPLTAGPVWDFDWQAFSDKDRIDDLRGGNSYTGRAVTEWLYSASDVIPWYNPFPDYNNDQPYMWYPLLFRDETFRSRVQERWPAIYAALQLVPAAIDSFAEKNRVSDSFNSAMWPLMQVKSAATTYSVAFNGDEDLSFDESIALMKEVYTERLEWMNSSITAGNFDTDAE